MNRNRKQNNVDPAFSIFYTRVIRSPFLTTTMTQETKTSDGIKHDQGKDRWDLLPLEVIQEVVKVLTFGAKKYTANNWKNIKDKERYYAAAMRHITEWRSGNDHDPETNLHHLTHAMTNMMFLLYFIKKENNHEQKLF